MKKEQWEKDFDKKADDLIDSGISWFKMSIMVLLALFIIILGIQLIKSGSIIGVLGGGAIIIAFIHGYFEGK